MNKNQLRQYIDLEYEIQETKRRIQETEEEIDDINTRGYIPNIQKKKKYLYAKRLRLHIHNDKLEAMRDDILYYIQSLENSRIRRILTYRYIDGMTWDDVARNIGPGYTADAVRIEHQRFLSHKEREGEHNEQGEGNDGF